MWTISNLPKRNFSLDSRLCFLKDLGRGNRLYEKLGLLGFNDQYFPELFDTEDRFGTSGIDGGGLGLVEYNHGCERDVVDKDLLCRKIKVSQKSMPFVTKKLYVSKSCDEER